MSRRRKHQPPYGQPGQPSVPAVAAPRWHSGPAGATTSNGARPPDEDRVAALLALQAQIEELRRDLNARLDALAASVDALMPSPMVTPAVPTHVPSVSVQDRRSPTLSPLSPGDTVYVPELGASYRVVEVAPGGATFKVQMGTMRVEVRRGDAWPLDDTAEAPGGTPTATSHAPHTHPEVKATIPEIDLHGYSEEDALITLEIFLHHAFVERMPRVRIIHGKGNGILRAAVRRELSRNPLVRGVDTGPHFHGDDGVTLADLDL